MDAPFHGTAHYSHADWEDLCDDLRDTPWKDTFKLSVSGATAAAEFCQLVHARTDVIFFMKNIWSTLVLLILP